MNERDFSLLVDLEYAQKFGDYSTLMERAHSALKQIMEVHEPIKAMINPGRHERVVNVCVGCGTDDGNFQRWPCPTVRSIEGS